MYVLDSNNVVVVASLPSWHKIKLRDILVPRDRLLPISALSIYLDISIGLHPSATAATARMMNLHAIPSSVIPRPPSR